MKQPNADRGAKYPIAKGKSVSVGRDLVKIYLQTFFSGHLKMVLGVVCENYLPFRHRIAWDKPSETRPIVHKPTPSRGNAFPPIFPIPKNAAIPYFFYSAPRSRVCSNRIPSHTFPSEFEKSYPKITKSISPNASFCGAWASSTPG